MIPADLIKTTVGIFAVKIVIGAVLTAVVFWLRKDHMYSCGFRKWGKKNFLLFAPVIVIAACTIIYSVVKNGVTIKTFFFLAVLSLEAGFCEEVMCRGIPLGNTVWRKKSFRQIVGLLIYTSILFGALHITNAVGSVDTFTEADKTVVEGVCTVSLGYVSQGEWTIELKVMDGTVVLYLGSWTGFINLNTGNIDVSVTPPKLANGTLKIDSLTLHDLSATTSKYSVWYSLSPLGTTGTTIDKTMLTPTDATGEKTYTLNIGSVKSGLYLMTTYIVVGEETPTSTNTIGQEVVALHVVDSAVTTVSGAIEVNKLGNDVNFNINSVVLNVALTMTAGAGSDGNFNKSGTNTATASISFSGKDTAFTKTIKWYADDECVATATIADGVTTATQNFTFRNAGYKTLTCTVLFDGGTTKYGDSASIVIFAK